MTPEQAAAYVMAQAACAMAEIAGMQAQDRFWAQQGGAGHSDVEYLAVMDRFCINHNAVLSCFQEANR